MEVHFTPQVRRQFKKLETPLQEEALQKIELFKDPTHHASLNVHALKGRLAGRISFSVNYRYRIIFMWEKKNVSAILLSIGDHSIYS